MAQKLMTEPFSLSPDQIAKLTDYQIVEVLFRTESPRDRGGVAPGGGMSREQIQAAVRRARIKAGVPLTPPPNVTVRRDG